MHMSRLLPAMLALGGLAHVIASSDEGANEVREMAKLPLSAMGDSRRQEPSDAVTEPIANDGSEEEVPAQELNARDSAAAERERWCRRGERWDRRWHRCYWPLRRPSCPRDEDAYCSRGRRDWRDWVRYDEHNPWCWRDNGHGTFCSRPGRESNTIVIIEEGGGYYGEE
ncbi:hypothetical protein F4782DRAFT_515712 [Xylaria castorea]|nr:hypothetical protein F4782DRAFT_515712 [Xylaria castorea]